MGNPHRGEVTLKAGDKDYTLRFSIDAICRLEETTGKNIVELMNEMADTKRMSVTMVRQFVHAALHENHPEVTLLEAGELLFAGGGMLKALDKVTSALRAAFPDPEASGTPRPTDRAGKQKAKVVGTGPVS